MQAEIRDAVADFIENNGAVPRLDAVLVGENPASEVYIRNKREACGRVGIESHLHRLPADTSQDDLSALVTKLNKSQDVHGILIQLPLPKHLNEARVLEGVSVWKDVDAFHPENVGRMVQGRPRFQPCTPSGIQELLHREGIAVSGQHVVVIGRSEIVGKPMAIMLGQKSSPWGESACNATVTLCHSRTTGLASLTRQADIVIAAVGQPETITGDMIRPGAVVVDVGIHRTSAGLVGDVEAASVREVASCLTPVPGGVGPLTVTLLLRNTLTAAELAFH